MPFHLYFTLQKCHVSINWFFWFKKSKLVQLNGRKSWRWKPTESTNPTRSNVSNRSNKLAIGFIKNILISKVRSITRTVSCRWDFSVHFAFQNFQIKDFFDIKSFLKSRCITSGIDRGDSMIWLIFFRPVFLSSLTPIDRSLWPNFRLDPYGALYSYPNAFSNFPQFWLNITTSIDLTNLNNSFPTLFETFQLHCFQFHSEVSNLKLSNFSFFPTSISNYVFQLQWFFATQLKTFQLQCYFPTLLFSISFRSFQRKTFKLRFFFQLLFPTK